MSFMNNFVTGTFPIRKVMEVTGNSSVPKTKASQKVELDKKARNSQMPLSGRMTESRSAGGEARAQARAGGAESTERR